MIRRVTFLLSLKIRTRLFQGMWQHDRGKRSSGAALRSVTCERSRPVSSWRRCLALGTRRATSRTRLGLSWFPPERRLPGTPCASDVVDPQCGSWISDNDNMHSLQTIVTAFLPQDNWRRRHGRPVYDWQVTTLWVNRTPTLAGDQWQQTTATFGYRLRTRARAWVVA